MVKRLFASRGFLTLALIALLLSAAIGGYRLVKNEPAMRGFCALMPDSIGLFEGSNVTVRGIPVGTVTNIEPAGTRARVQFAVPADRELPADVGATTLSDTLIADRRLAIIGDARPDTPTWNPAECITKTLTPKSLTQTFTAIADLADELNGTGDDAGANLITGGLAALNDATTGHGGQVNDIVHALGSVLDSPDAAIGHIGQLIDTLGALSATAVNGWADIETMVSGLADLLRVFNEMAIPPIIDAATQAQDVLPAANDVIRMFGAPLLRKLDAIDPTVLFTGTGLGSLQDLLALIPAVSESFGKTIDPASGRPVLTYASPRVAIPAPDAALVCSAIDTLIPGRCDVTNGLADVDLTALVLATAGAR